MVIQSKLPMVLPSLSHPKSFIQSAMPAAIHPKLNPLTQPDTFRKCGHDTIVAPAP